MTGRCWLRGRPRPRGLRLRSRPLRDSSAVIGPLCGLGHLSALRLCGLGHASARGLVTNSESRPRPRPPGEHLHWNESPDRPQAQGGLRSLTWG